MMACEVQQQLTLFPMFTFYSCPYLAKYLTPAIPAVGALLFIFVMSSLFHTSFSDPGIIPRATAEEAIYTEKQIGNVLPILGPVLLFCMVVWYGRNDDKIEKV